MAKKIFWKKFLQEYPIIPVLIVVFIFGIWIGFKIGQKNMGFHPAAGKPAPRAVPEKPPVYEEKNLKQVAAKPSQAPKQTYPIFSGFRIPGKPGREVKITPVPQKPEKPKLLIIIDDIGYNTWYQDLIFSIQQPIVLAILPQIPYSKHFAEESRKRGFEVILHQPFEPNDPSEDTGPGEIKVGMNATEIKQILDANLKTVPGAIGINNHMGSKATQDWHLMLLVSKELQRKKLIFLDSRTVSKSVAYEAARAVGIPALTRDVFLDSENEVKFIEKQLEQAAKISKANGLAIVIGHPYENTLWVLKQRLPKLEADGFQFVTIQDIVS